MENIREVIGDPRPRSKKKDGLLFDQQSKHNRILIFIPICFRPSFSQVISVIFFLSCLPFERKKKKLSNVDS